MPAIRKNTHQQHLEDLVLLGPEGLEELDDKFEGMLDMLEDNSDRVLATSKIDGSPSLFIWSKYEGYPDNSVALKGFTNGPQTAISTPEQVDQKYGDRPTMSQMLKYGLELAPHIPAGECWQGDCLFTSNSKKEEEIFGKDYITFQPNKIIYAFAEDQPGYEQVKNADFGICFHTIYRGTQKQQSFRVDPKRLDAPSNFYIMSPAIKANKKSFDLKGIRSGLETLHKLEEELLSNRDYETLISNELFMKYWNTFENATLADKQQVTISEDTFIEELKDYIKDKQTKEYDKKMSTLKTEKGRTNATQKYNAEVEELATIVETNRSLLTALVKTLNQAARVKMLLWEGFKQTQLDYKTFYKSKTKGYLNGDMEGIAVSDQDGNIVKIVDRSMFSSYNRDPDIEAGWEHNESLEENMDLNESIELYMSYGFSEEEAKELDRLKRLYPSMIIPKVDKDTGHWVIPREWENE